MLRKLFAILLIALIIAAGIAGYRLFQQINTTVSKAVHAIPFNAALIIESKDFPDTWKKLANTTEFWNTLSGIEFVNNIDEKTRFLDSLISAEGKVAQLIKSQSAFISLHLTGTDRYDYLFTVGLKNINQISQIEGVVATIAKGKSISKRSYDKVQINEIQIGDGSSFSYTISKGIFVGSFSSVLVEDAIRQLNAGNSLMTSSTNPGFNQVQRTASDKAHANIYINYAFFPDLMTLFATNSKRNRLKGLANFASWTEMDLKIKPSALMFNGLTYPNDSAEKYLNLFRKQRAPSIDLPQIVPDNTAMLMYYGISDFSRFYTDYKSYLENTNMLYDYNKRLEQIKDANDINLEEDLLALLGNEFAVISTGNINSPNPETNIIDDFAVFKLLDPEEADSNFSILTGDSGMVEIFRDHKIYFIDIPNLWPNVLGDAFTAIIKNYFAVIDEYVVFANQPAALRNFIAANLSGRTMTRDVNYIAFTDNISSNANCYLYYNIPICLKTNLWQSSVTEPIANSISKSVEVLQEFEALAIQISSGSVSDYLNKDGSMFYTNLYLGYNPDYKEKTQLFRQTKLDAPLTTKPWIVTNHYTDDKEIFIQDEANNVYLIDKSGNTLWKRKIDEKIIGDVTQIDIYKSNKLQLLFNTRTQMYLIDRKGRNVEKFPTKLLSPATNGLIVMDYDNNKKYRILIAGEDRKIYNYDKYGKAVEGWDFEQTKAIVRSKITHFSVKGKDYIITFDNDGNLYAVDRRGVRRMKEKQWFTYLFNHEYELIRSATLDETTIMITDSAGTVITRNFKGELDSIVFDDFTYSPDFKYADINMDGKRDYIFLDKNELIVFSENKEVVFSQSFDENASYAPMIFSFSDNSTKIGVVTSVSDALFLFNSEGSVGDGFPLYGNSPFSIIDQHDQISLVTGAHGNYLYIYTLE